MLRRLSGGFRLRDRCGTIREAKDRPRFRSGVGMAVEVQAHDQYRGRCGKGQDDGRLRAAPGPRRRCGASAQERRDTISYVRVGRISFRARRVGPEPLGARSIAMMTMWVRS